MRPLIPIKLWKSGPWQHGGRSSKARGSFEILNHIYIVQLDVQSLACLEESLKSLEYHWPSERNASEHLFV
ncbi:MAG: hypothetical protein DMF61_01675 [Blastocatellia bacterium AA13]|nr:MAG: hypothetical protein DMF61_01675 [Blastocatellia bacterium AA13]